MSHRPALARKISRTNSIDAWEHGAVRDSADTTSSTASTTYENDGRTFCKRSSSQAIKTDGCKSSISPVIADLTKCFKGKRSGISTVEASLPTHAGPPTANSSNSHTRTPSNTSQISSSAEDGGHSKSATYETQSRFVQLPTRLGLSDTSETRSEHEHSRRKPSIREFTQSGGDRPDGDEQREPLWFKPWTGDGIEDQLNEQVLKDGFISKPKVSNELGTAKPSLLPHLRNGDGLRNLSQLFLIALDGKRKSCAITSPSTFKPPPRVTLTDARKSAWFADLANNLVPLRRLSRTIPHGIRGKLLLDQCVSHQVPISRTLWLVKCVGANELRAFRRKGISSSVISDNEQKWIQDWTFHVLDFLWTLSQSQPTLVVLSHAIQVVMCIYAEGLINQSQFIDHILSKIGDGPYPEMALYLGVVQTWLPEIVSGHRHSQKLAAACIDILHSHQDIPTSGKERSLIKHVEGLATSIFTVAPRAFVYPIGQDDTSSKHLSIYQAMLEKISSKSLHVGQARSRICRLLFGAELDQHTRNTRLLSALDHCTSPDHRKYLSTSSSFGDANSGLDTILKWACTRYRAQKGSCCIARVLISRLSSTIPDFKQIILNFFLKAPSLPETSPVRLGALGAALASSELLDVNAYMRALIASGAMYSSENKPSSSQCHVSVLMALSSANTSSQVYAMREHLLHSFNGSLRTNTYGTERPIFPELELPTLWTQWHVGQSSQDSSHQHSQYISQQPSALELLSTAIRTLHTNPKRLRLSCCGEVRTLCMHLQHVTDVIAFQELLPPLIRVADYGALLPVSQLVCAFQGALGVTGQFEHLRDLLVGRYRALRLQEPSNREVVTVLRGFSLQEKWQRRYLEDELRMCEQSQCIAANTPASEILIPDTATPHDFHSEQSQKPKTDTATCVTMACVEHLVTHTDTTETMSEPMLRAANAFLVDSIVQVGAIGGDQSLLLIKFLLWILRNLGPQHGSMFEEMVDTCSHNDVRVLVVNLIVYHENLLLPILVDFVDAHPSPIASCCLYRLMLNLIGSSTFTQIEQGEKRTHTATSDPAPNDAQLLRLVDNILSSNDGLSTSAHRVGLAVMAKLYVHHESGSVHDLRTSLLSRVGAAIKDDTQHWAQVMSALPEQLNVLPQIRERAEESLFYRIKPNLPPSHWPYSDFDITRLLAIAIEANAWTRHKIRDRDLAQQIVTAIRYCSSPFDPEQPEHLEIFLSLSLLHHNSFTKDTDLVALLSLLTPLLTNVEISAIPSLHSLTFDTVGFFVMRMTQSTISTVVNKLPPPLLTNTDIQYLHSIRPDPYSGIRIQTTASTTPSGVAAAFNFNFTSDDPTEPPYELKPFEVKRWEMLPDANAKEGENDAPLGLKLFGARRAA